jgi:arylsulfatase A-like enzyme
LLGVLRANGYATAAITSNVDAGFKSLGLSADLTEHEETAFSFLTLSWLRDLGVYPTLLGEQMYADLSVIFPFLGFPQRTSYYGESDDTLDLAKQTISRLREPFFLFIHFHQPHDPYASPSIRTRIKRFLAQFGALKPSELKTFAAYSPESQPMVDNYKRQYEAAVQRVDSALGELIGWLEAKAWFSNSLLIVTGDHGESFERGYMNHGEELYENSTHVPLLIRFPGQRSGQRATELVQSLDIGPTILRALKLSVPPWMEGQPLLLETPPEERATVTVNYKRPENDTVYRLPTKLAIWWDRYKLVVTCAPGTTELYDLVSDPNEQLNLASQNNALADALKRRLKLQIAKQPREPKLACRNI